MKIKYFLRGLGAGILFTTLLLFGMYSYKMSDSKIVERARELGMEYEKEDSKNDSSKNLPQESSTENTTPAKNTEDTTPVKNTENTTPVKNEQTTNSPTQQSTPATVSPTSSSEESIEVSISSGMNSENISELLERAGVIDSADDFNKYLVDNNLGRYIRSGDYQLKSGMSYSEIAQALRTGQ